MSREEELSEYDWASATFERNLAVISAARVVIGLVYGARMATELFELLFYALALPLANSMDRIAGPCPRYAAALRRYTENSSLSSFPISSYNRALVEVARLFNSSFSRFRILIDDPANPPARFRYEISGPHLSHFYMARLEPVLEEGGQKEKCERGGEFA